MTSDNYIKGEIWGGIPYRIRITPGISLSDESVLHQQIREMLDRVTRVFSPFEKTSELVRINLSQEQCPVSSDFKTLFIKSQEIYRKTEGAFNPALMTLIRAYGFSAEPSQKEMPTRLGQIDIRERTNFAGCSIKDNVLMKAHPLQELDFCGIAKGYAVDLIAELLDTRGFTNYLVDIGGEIRTRGLSQWKKKWSVGVTLPDRNGKIVLELDFASVATSGDYYQSRLYNGKTISHCIHPKTLLPVSSAIRSVTVMAESCAEADAYATAFWVNGIDWSLDFLQTQPALGALFIFEKNGILCTRMSDRIKERLVS